MHAYKANPKLRSWLQDLCELSSSFSAISSYQIGIIPLLANIYTHEWPEQRTKFQNSRCFQVLTIKLMAVQNVATQVDSNQSFISIIHSLPFSQEQIITMSSLGETLIENNNSNSALRHLRQLKPLSLITVVIFFTRLLGIDS